LPVCGSVILISAIVFTQLGGANKAKPPVNGNAQPALSTFTLTLVLAKIKITYLAVKTIGRETRC